MFKNTCEVTQLGRARAGMGPWKCVRASGTQMEHGGAVLCHLCALVGE